MCDFKDLRRLCSIGPQPRAGSGLQDRPPPACPILVGWVPTATAAKFFRASYWNSSLKQALRMSELDGVVVVEENTDLGKPFLVTKPVLRGADGPVIALP